MQVNFFSWIREGVKRSVLLGVSDAVEHLGDAPETSQEQLLSYLRASEATAGSKRRKTAPRRLGRSLKQLNASDESAGKPEA